MTTAARRDPLTRPDPVGTVMRRVLTSPQALTALCLAGIMAGAVAMRIWALGGASFALGADDARYVAVAQNLAGGHLPSGQAEWFGARMVFLWPVALVFKITGADDYRAVVWPLAASLLSVLAAFLIGRELRGRRAGLVAAALVAVAPVEVLMSTRLSPDAVMPAFTALAVWAALRARRSTCPGAWLAGSGLLLGAAWSARETAVLMLPVLVLAGWPVIRRGGRAALAGATGLLVVPLVEVVIFAMDGRPLWPLTATPGAGAFRSPAAGWDATTPYLGSMVNEVVQPGSLVALALPTILIALAVAVGRHDRTVILPAAWLGWGFLYLEAGTLVSVDKPMRFLTLITVPAALLVAIALDGRLSPLLVPLLAAVTVLAMTPRIDGSRRGTNVVLVSRVADVMRDLPRAPVLAADYTWWAKLNAYLPTGRLAVRRAIDPAFLTATQRRESRRLLPLPAVASYRGGYVVTGPVRRTAGWPSNWDVVRSRMRSGVPWGRLVPVARVGRATIWHWPT